MKKRIILITVALIMIVIIGVAAIPAVMRMIENRQEELEMTKQEELRQAFFNQNIAFTFVVKADPSAVSREEEHGYMPVNLRNQNSDGIASGTYRDLALYRKETGSSLTYEQVIEYLSQGFEDDGEVRIYTNGRHPEIAAFVEWSIADSGRLERYRYSERLIAVYSDYGIKTEGFPRSTSFVLLPTEMLDELIRKEAATDFEYMDGYKIVSSTYQMDLKSIQDKYIAEGKAVVSEDGKTIEFIVPEK
jgi:hypothetical protein